MTETPRTTRHAGVGVTLVADEFGDASRQPVFLLHGSGQTRHSWAGTAAQLARSGFYALSFDLRGHGDSDWAADGDYAHLAFVRDFEAIARRLARPPIVVGASLGGIVGMYLASSRVAKALVLVDITPTLQREGVNRVLSFMAAHKDGFASVADAVRAVREYLPHRSRSNLDDAEQMPTERKGLLKNLRKGADGRFRWHWDPRFLEARGLKAADKLPDKPSSASPFQDMVRAISVPTLLIRGANSELVKDVNVREFFEMVPHAFFLDVGDAHHMVVGDSNDVFNAGLEAFLRAVESGRLDELGPDYWAPEYAAAARRRRDRASLEQWEQRAVHTAKVHKLHGIEHAHPHAHAHAHAHPTPKL